MEKRLGLELRGRKPDEVDELNLDNCKSLTIEGLTDEFCNLETISLNGAGLTTLKGFPSLPKLRKLELSDNRISSGLANLCRCPALKSLNLSGNQIKELADLQPLSQLRQLKSLDLFHCQVTNVDNYRSAVFKLIPSLVGLDGFDKNDAEVEDSEDDANCVDDEEDDDDDDVVEDDDDVVVAGDEEEAADEDGSDECDDEEDDENEVGLNALYQDNINDGEENDGDYDGEGAEEEVDDEALEEEENESTDVDTSAGDCSRGKKRKHEDEDEEEKA